MKTSMSVGGFRNKMKKLILISALLFSFNGWADDEFPIEITCEFATLILFLSFAEDPKDSYFTVLSYVEQINSYKQYMNKKNTFNKYEIDHSSIRIRRIFGFNLIAIDRYSGSANWSTKFTIDGRCYKGRKEYKERKF